MPLCGTACRVRYGGTDRRVWPAPKDLRVLWRCAIRAAHPQARPGNSSGPKGEVKMPIQYVDYGGTQMLQPPYNAENVGFYAFLIHADVAALQKLLDDRLNRPSGGAVEFE